jgi:hypothetical protein
MSDPIGNEARAARRERRLGDALGCVLCGYRDPAALIAEHRATLESHHVLGRAHQADLTVVLCRNCHAIQTERMRDGGVALERDPSLSVLETVVAVLRALAVFLRSLAVSLEDWATRLAALVVALDQAMPSWRTLEP